VSVSRAGGKLEAALDRFGLAAAVRAAQAVDVGASTGGFTEVLLAHGAAHVVAVDVGHGQLAAGLRADPRVTSMEGADWKRLPLSEAPGPFDFFTVDVSFVAARNMLRGLAFRLRPGAAGVVLVKPQFELPDRQVRDGRVDDPNLRAAALDKVRRKAEALGFSLLDHADSPVAGGSGTVEILTHLRFEGRPAALPQPGERRRDEGPGRARAAAHAAGGERLRWFAVVAPGLEEVAGREVAALPGVDAASVRVVPGGVELAGPLEAGYRANLWLRVATRVLARVGEVEAREFGKLRRRLAGLSWAAFVAPGAPIAVRASASRCRLYHTGALAETVAAAVGDAVKGARAAAAGEEPAVSILLRGEDDRFTASVDASGELLHRRGARVEIGEAPLRETLASGLLALAGFRAGTSLCDPMCGAGTIPLEACALALDIAPGLARAFALEGWPLAQAHPELGATLRDEARARAHTSAGAPVTPILASDRDPEMVAIARRNAERAGLADRITFACAELADLRPPPDLPPGLVMVNPPYGKRLGDARVMGRTYRDLGRALKARFRGWRAAVLLPSRADPGALGLRVVDRHRLKNGGLPVTLIIVEVA
jgi:putative N6-adenine-specific DNA methylase